MWCKHCETQMVVFQKRLKRMVIGLTIAVLQEIRNIRKRVQVIGLEESIVKTMSVWTVIRQKTQYGKHF